MARVFRFILKQVGNRADAEELTQETFLIAFRSADRFRGESTPETWLFGIAVNVVRGHLRRSPERRHRFIDDEVLSAMPSEAEDPFQSLESSRRVAALDAALSRLPQDWRETVVCVAMEGFSYEEAAAILGVPIGTVRSRLSRARDRLKAELATEARV